MMHTMDPKQLSPSARSVFQKIEFDEDEKLLFEVRKHWFGLFLIYLTGSFIIFVLLIAAVGVVLAPGVDFRSVGLPLLSISVLLALLGSIITAIAAYLYKSNVIIVTSDKLAQLLMQGLFHQKISQLSIGDVQDVTVRQHGIFPHMFHYGTVVIETAGEQQNYTFTYAPDPYECAKAIVNSHEENLKLHGN